MDGTTYPGGGGGCPMASYREVYKFRPEYFADFVIFQISDEERAYSEPNKIILKPVFS